MTDAKPFTLAEVAKWVRRAEQRAEKPEPPRCPRCGSYEWTYKGDKQVCASCGRE